MRQITRNSSVYRLRRKVGRLRRFLLHRRGDGVHSPYAFHLISKVLRNPHPFASFANLRERTKASREELRRSHRDRVVVSTKQCELVFRLVHHHGKGSVVLLSMSESLLPPYLQATGQVDRLFSDLDEDLGVRTIIVEDATPQDLELLPSFISKLTCQRRDLMLLYYKYNPRMRRHRDEILETIHPDILIDQGDFDVCVWGERLTPCKHFAYY